MNDRTMTFSIGDQTEQEIRNILTLVYDSLKEKGYNPINQIVGYILSEDPPIITPATLFAALTAIRCCSRLCVIILLRKNKCV